MRVASFRRHPGLHIYSSNLKRKPFLSEYNMMCYETIMIHLNRGYQRVLRECTCRAGRKCTRQGNSGTSIPFDPFPVFESGEIVIDRVFKIWCGDGHPRPKPESMSHLTGGLWVEP